VKAEAFFHLTANLCYVLMVILSALMPVAMVIRFSHGWYEVLFLDLPFFIAATMSVSSFYMMSQKELGMSKWQRVKYLPFIMALGIGMCLSNAKAVLEGLVGHQSEFTRTPKLGVGKLAKGWAAKKYQGMKTALPLLELAFGV